MTLTYDSETSCGYLKVSAHKVDKTVEVSERVVCDLDKEGMLCGIEFINVSQSELDSFVKPVNISEGVK